MRFGHLILPLSLLLMAGGWSASALPIDSNEEAADFCGLVSSGIVDSIEYQYEMDPKRFAHATTNKTSAGVDGTFTDPVAAVVAFVGPFLRVLPYGAQN